MTTESIDYGFMCRNMRRVIECNITDPTLRRLVLPSFITTSVDDEMSRPSS